MYEPEVDDYVRWTNDLGQVHEGWVYFKADPINNSKRVSDGWNPISQYITIEISIRPKEECVYTSGKPMRHKNIHSLLLCNRESWCELEYIKNRRKDQGQSIGMYKSQEGRYEDTQ